MAGAKRLAFVPVLSSLRGPLWGGEAVFLENVGPLSAVLRPHILSPTHTRAKSCKMLLKQKVDRTDCNQLIT